MTIRGKFYKTLGWTAVGIGLYLVGLGVAYDGGYAHTKTKRPNDNIIDADFTVVD